MTITGRRAAGFEVEWVGRSDGVLGEALAAGVGVGAALVGNGVTDGAEGGAEVETGPPVGAELGPEPVQPLTLSSSAVTATTPVSRRVRRR